MTVTAEVDGKKATMNFVVWQAREYDKIVTKPDIPTAISNREDAFNAFSQQYVTVHLSRTDGTVSLPDEGRAVCEQQHDPAEGYNRRL